MENLLAMEDIVHPEELLYFVSSLRKFEIHEVGCEKWIDCHEKTVKLCHQAALEVSVHREEAVKECLISKDKLKVLVHEAFCVLIWKNKILPHLLEVDPNPQASFFIYTVLFHEGSVISLLELLLFHESACESLQDTAVDLVDYCIQAISQLIGLTSMGYHENETKIDVDETILTEMERQKRDLIFKIGLRCISILNFLAEYATRLPLGAIRRMVVTHDLPWLLGDLLHFRPWYRRLKSENQKFIGEKWTTVSGELMSKIVRHEAQTWFCLRQLLFNSELMQSYEMNDSRRSQLGKLQGLINEILLDQLPPLVDLKEYLCRLNLTAGPSAGIGQNVKKMNLILEELPLIKENIIHEAEKNGGFSKIAQRQKKIFLISEHDEILKLAQRLSSPYSTDVFAEIEEKLAMTDKSKDYGICKNCSGAADKKCSKCKIASYCSRECQKQHWQMHKLHCTSNTATSKQS